MEFKHIRKGTASCPTSALRAVDQGRQGDILTPSQQETNVNLIINRPSARLYATMRPLIEKNLSKQVAMRACTGANQDKLIMYVAVDEQPVRLDMALTETGIVARKRMITILRRQRSANSQYAEESPQVSSCPFRASASACSPF